MFVFVILLLTSCHPEKNISALNQLSVEGPWVEMLGTYGIEKFHRGVHWQLAGIGLSSSDWDLKVEPEIIDNHWRVTLTFIEPKDCLERLINSLDKDSPFVAQLSQLTQHPVHVSRLTSQPETLEEWRGDFFTDAETLISESLIASNPRVVGFNSIDHAPSKIAYYAYERIDPERVETIDVMPNGRLRYGQYFNEELAYASELGTVARCQWCHEAKLLDLQYQADVDGFDAYSLFSQSILVQNNSITGLHDSIHKEISILDRGSHEHGEQIFEIYLNPTITGLSNEWNVSVADVEATLNQLGLTGYVLQEYPEWGIVYSRQDLNNALGEPHHMPMSPRDWPIDEWPDLLTGITCL